MVGHNELVALVVGLDILVHMVPALARQSAHRFDLSQLVVTRGDSQLDALWEDKYQVVMKVRKVNWHWGMRPGLGVDREPVAFVLNS